MDIYLSQEAVSSKMLCRDNLLTLEPSITEDFTAPYGVNMSLLLPEVTYLRPGLCRTMRHIKAEPSPSLVPPSCQCNSMPPPLPEHTGVYSTPDATGSVFINQEVPGFQDVSQLLNSDLDALVHSLQLNSIPVTPLALPVSNVHVGPVQNQRLVFNRQHRMAYLPLSPPNSEPPSPGRGEELLHKLSPPPSYEASIASKLTFPTPNPLDPEQPSNVAPLQTSDRNSNVGLGQSPGPGQARFSSPTPTLGVGPLSPVLCQSAPAKHSRRTNPDLERRRIHHCDVPGERQFELWNFFFFFYFTGR